MRSVAMAAMALIAFAVLAAAAGQTSSLGQSTPKAAGVIAAQAQTLMNEPARQYRCTDINGDGYTTLADFAFMGMHYNSCVGDERYDERADYDSDNCVNSIDFAIMTFYYGAANEDNYYCTH